MQLIFRASSSAPQGSETHPHNLSIPPIRTGRGRPGRLPILKTLGFVSLVVLLGLGSVFFVKRGTSFLERHDAPSRPEATAGRILARDLGGTLDTLPQGVAHVKIHRGLAAAGTKDGKALPGGSTPLARSDLVTAFVSDLGHEDYVRFSRVWRQGIRTYIATNHSVSSVEQEGLFKLGESWGAYPDDRPLHTLALKGDSRAALAPFLAFKEFGATFKWLFYGDDDTFFFVDAALEMLQHLDPEMPYFLTDHMWWTEKWQDAEGNIQEATHHPNRAAPLCVPCQYAGDTSSMPFPHPRGCPCTTATICNADREGIFFRGPKGQCGIPRVPIRTYSMHGGAGGILSVGLLKNISFQAFEDCVTTTYTTGGDAVITICLWQAGFGMTTPNPTWHPQGLHMFDVGREAQEDRDEIVSRVARPMGNLLEAAAGFCKSGLCKVELDNLVTLHMRSRKFSSKACHSEISRVLAGLGNVAFGRTATVLAEGQIEDQVYVSKQVGLALETYKRWRDCQELQAATPGATCPEAALAAAQNGTTTFQALTAEGNTLETAARNLAAELIKQIFERYPSPTGTYGEIPVGRE